MRGDPYRFVARWYDKIFERMTRGLRLLGLSMFRPNEGMAILDVGCGTGVHLELYRTYRCDMHGIDLSPSMIDIARKRLGDSAELHLGDASEMPYEDRSFDLVISMSVLHEMNHSTRSSVMSEMKRVLKDSGRILLIDFHASPICSFEGRLNKLIILLSEIAAGREHFRNYRHFMTLQGLPALVREHALVVEKQRVAGGGAMAVFLLSTE